MFERFSRTAALVSTFAAIAFSTSAWSQQHSLKTGQFLKVNQYIVEQGGRSFAIMQPDGNFCVYKGSSPNDNKGVIWCSSKTAPGGEFFAIMQGDANFCVYKGTSPADNKGFLWCSGKTAPQGNNYYLNVAPQGISVVYMQAPPSVLGGSSLPVINKIWASY